MVASVHIAGDISTIKKYEAELEEAKEAAEKASSAKSDFLANMSHDIRTPLNAIVGIAELMAERKLETGAREDLRVIQTNSELLLDFLSDILDMSRIEEGKKA